MALFSVPTCACCGQTHINLRFEEFRHPIVEYFSVASLLKHERLTANVTYTHWALCPETGEPILMRMAEVKQAEEKSHA